MAEKLSPVAFMHKFMKLLSQDYQEQQNKLDLTLQAMTTDIEGKSVLHNANELKNAIKADISSILQNGTAKDFLKQKCNIDLDNEDTGSLLGFDCSARDILNDADVVKEEGEIKNHPASAVINGCTFTFTNYSDTKRKFVMNGLYTWWIPLAFDKIKECYGLEYTEDSFVRQMPINLYDKPSQNGLIEGANVIYTYSSGTGVVISQTLNINMNDLAYGTIIVGDKSGATELNKFGSLDRTLLHELTHALMGSNIQWFGDFPSWFKEGGTAVLIEGADDKRQEDILDAVSDTTIIDNGFSNSPTNANEYSVGFLAMRYLLANYADRQQKITFESNPLEPFEIMWQKNAHGIKSEFCISRDADLNKIMNEFSDFVQRNDYNEVQPWDLMRDNNMGKTFRIPMKGHEHKVEDETCVLYKSPYYIMHHSIYISTIAENEYYFPFLGIEKNKVFTFSIDKIDDAIDYYNNHLLSFAGKSLTSIIIFLEDVSVNILSKNDYDRLMETIEVANRVSEQGIIGKLIIAQYNRIPYNLYYTLDSMSDIEFKNYFFTEFSDDEQNTIQYLLNKGALFLDCREDEWNKYNMLISKYNSSEAPVSIAYGWNLTRESRNSTSINKPDSYDFFSGYIITGLDNIYGADNINYYFWHNRLEEIFTDCFDKAAKELHLQPNSIFKVEQKLDIDFPCFYLSTGVFKPKDWINEGLRYPEHVIKQENQNDEYIPFNIHVLYDKNMRFDLQGQGTAKRTTGAKGDAYILDGVDGNPHTGYHPVESDVIPGIGCPMIVRSQENKITYPYIECYFTKTNYSGTVTLIFYSAGNEAQNPVFQSVAFGLGKSEESSYKYPLYTAGGSCGLYPYGYRFTWTDTGRPPTTHHIYIGGQKINFDMSKGESLSSLLYPCGIEDSNISNVRIMQPDGRWVSAKNFMQTQESMIGTCGSMLTKSDIESSTLPMIYPTISDIDNVDRFTFTQPVMVIRKRVDEEDESGFTLAFDGVKAKADRLRAIFTAKDGHEYLSVPNGWYSRTFGIPYTIGATESGENILDVIARLNKNMPKQNYVLIIDLG